MSGVAARTRSSGRRRRRPPVRRILLSVLVIGSLLFLTTSWIGIRVWQTRGHLTSAAGLAGDLAAQIAAGDTEQARRTLDALQRQTAASRSSSGDTIWWAAGHTPYAGKNLAAIHAVAEALDDLARGTFPGLLRIDLAALLPHGGRVDVAAIARSASDIAAAEAAAEAVRSRFTTPATGLVDSVAEAVTQLHATLDRLVRITAAARQAAAVIPPMLGAKGDRTYLLAFQNPAEVRATGGMMGAYAVVRVSDGRPKIVKQGAGTGIGMFKRPVLRLNEDVQRLFGVLPGIYPADVNLSPHFPAAAEIYREMYRRDSGEKVDGVIAVDPVALAYLLRATGPIQIPGSDALASTTAVRSLLSDIYRRPPDAQDPYFARSAKAVFDALLTRTVDPRTVAAAFTRATEERRLLFWSAHPDEQKIIADTAVGGVLPDQEARPSVGVYLNDGTGAKLSYYLTQHVELRVGACRPDQRRELALTVTLGSTAPRSGLSESVLGYKERPSASADRYTFRTLVSVYSPVGGAVLRARLDGKPIGLGAGRERRHQIGVAAVDLSPGQRRVLEVDLLTPVTDIGVADLRLTPLATSSTTRISSAPSCTQ